MWDELHKWSMNKIWKYEEKKILKSQIAFTCFIFGGSSAVHDKIMLKSINQKNRNFKGGLLLNRRAYFFVVVKDERKSANNKK